MAQERQYWLLKSEPEAFSIDDLARAPKQTTSWDGVRNYQARNFMRAMQVGDQVLYYHSNTTPPSVVGIAEVVKGAYPDATQFDKRGVALRSGQRSTSRAGTWWTSGSSVNSMCRYRWICSEGNLDSRAWSCFGRVRGFRFSRCGRRSGWKLSGSLKSKPSERELGRDAAR